MLRTGEFHSLAQEKQERLIRRLRELFRALKRVYDPTLLKRVMAGAIFLIGWGWGEKSHAQQFSLPIGDPFGMVTPPPLYGAPAIGDLDDDGDPDLMSGATDIFYFENSGTPSAPAFDSSETNPFGISGLPNYSLPTLVDLDDDGDLDLMVGESMYGTLNYYENTGSAGSPTFAAPQVNPFNLDTVQTGYYSGLVSPEFVDIDDDGDLDLFVGGNLYGQLLYYENNGSASNPNFSSPSPNPFGTDTITNFYSGNPTFADLDHDGDMDLIQAQFIYIASQGEAFVYYENVGDAGNPDFSAGREFNPFGLTHPAGNTYQIGASFVDFDDDGDQDLLSGTYSSAFGSFFYYESLGDASSIETNASDEGRFELYPQPASERLHFRYEGDERIERLSIMDMQGRTVMDKALENDASHERTLEVSSLRPGIYLLKARGEDKTLTKRLVIE